MINVDPDKDIIDLSLRYVTEREKQLKMKDYKDRKKAYKIVELALTGTPYESEIKRVFYLLDENFENPYIGLEEARRKGKTVLLKLGIADEIAEILMKEIMERVKPSYTSLVYQVKVESLARDGVFKIMDYLEKCKKNLEKRDIKNVEITVISPPLYRIRVLHENPKYVEQTFKKVALEMLKVAKEMNIEAEFKTER
ncbi:hypothetical protein DRO02_01690 [archaeon]|nr:MAG: hypothetical protein DRO02_01690 [archaeon]RLG65687.1 MAG: hypothetical protein DRO21_01295 [archaeon]HDM23569.1 hypothetical protein [Candidatus Bathyarchaeota archaeon]